MFKPELLRNKFHAVLLILCTLPVLFLEGDATATIFFSFIAIPLFFSKKKGNQFYMEEKSNEKHLCYPVGGLRDYSYLRCRSELKPIKED